MAFRIFVGNLAHEVRDSELRELFSTLGEIADCRVIFSRETGESRGFAFLEFKKEEEGQAALQKLDGTDFHGRPLRLKEATPAGGDGGGGRDAGRSRDTRPGAGRGPARGPRGEDGRGHSRGPGAGAPGPAFGQKEDSRKGIHRKPKDGSAGEKKGPAAGPGQGRPTEKARGGSRNRLNFEYEDEEDEDFQLFERDDEDLDYDPDLLERLNADPDDADSDEQGLDLGRS